MTSRRKASADGQGGWLAIGGFHVALTWIADQVLTRRQFNQDLIELTGAPLWIEPVQLARNLGFRAHDLREIQAIIEQHKSELLEAWHGHFGTGRG